MTKVGRRLGTKLNASFSTGFGAVPEPGFTSGADPITPVNPSG
jgi:hypothetical protein